MPQHKRLAIKRSGASKEEKKEKKTNGDKLKMLGKVSNQLSSSEMIWLRAHITDIMCMPINGNPKAADYGLPRFMCDHCRSSLIDHRFDAKDFREHLKIYHSII